MAGDKLAMDLTGLEAFASQLRSIRNTMDSTRKLFDTYESVLGSGKVAGALDSFEHNWKDGRGEIDKHLDGLAKLADFAVQQIRKTDGDLGDQLEKSVHTDGGGNANGGNGKGSGQG